MLAQYLDLKDQFNAEGYVEFEISNYDYAVFQVTGLGSAFNVYSTIDSGAITGISDGSIITSTNYMNISVLNLADYKYISQVGDDGIYRIDVAGRYIRLGQPFDTNTATKLLVMLAKIS